MGQGLTQGYLRAYNVGAGGMLVADHSGSPAGEVALLTCSDCWAPGLLGMLGFSQLGCFWLGMLGSVGFLAPLPSWPPRGSISPHNKAPAGCRGS